MVLSYPVSASELKITSGFGVRTAPTKGASTNHAGIDIAVPIGTSVLSAGFGTVENTGYTSSRGNFVKIDHGNGTQTIYQHLQGVNVQKGQTVLRGQTIGISGNTGTSTGAHLHFEVHQDGKAVDPLKAVGSSSSSVSGVLGGITGVDMSGVTGILKSNWLVIIGGLLVLAVLTK